MSDLQAIDVGMLDSSRISTQLQSAGASLKDGEAEHDAGLRLAEFERGIAGKTFTATVMASAMQYAFRRENLEYGLCSIGTNSPSSLPDAKDLRWIRLLEVGIDSKVPVIAYSQMSEKLLQFFHQPRRRKLVFFVSSNGIKVFVHVGLRSSRTDVGDDENSSIISTASHFSRTYWPGLKFHEVARADEKSPRNLLEEFLTFTYDNAGNKVYDAGLHAITGIPTTANDAVTSIGLFSIVDKLASGLTGKRWGFLVIADPMDSGEMSQAVFTCREFAGRAESMTRFQVSEALNETISHALSETWSVNYSESERKKKAGNSGRTFLKAGAAVGLATAGAAALAVACPALIPAILAGGEMVVGGLLANLGSTVMVARALKNKDAASKTHGTSYSRAVSNSVASGRSVTASDTIVNKHAEAMAKLLSSQIGRYEYATSVGAWETGVYMVGEDDETSRAGADIIKAMISGADSYAEPIRIHNLKPHGAFTGDQDPFLAIREFENPRIEILQNGQSFSHPLGLRYDNLRTVLHSKELARYINFPLSEVSGIPVKRIVEETGIPQPTEMGIELGTPIFRNESLPFTYKIDPNGLAKHSLVCGINGSGKTNTVLGILSSLGDIPFLVVEPAKREYVSWAMAMNDALVTKYDGNKELAKKSPDWIHIYMPGSSECGGAERFTLNPFDFVWLSGDVEPLVDNHADCLSGIINAALPMQEILPLLMDELVRDAYRSVKGVAAQTLRNEKSVLCWMPQKVGERPPVITEKLRLPTFLDMHALVAPLMKRRSYAPEVSRNLQAALESRIARFTRGWRRKLLNNEAMHNKAGWDEIFNKRVIINLTGLANDDDKAFLMGVILTFLYEYRQQLATCSDARNLHKGLVHLLVLEEAHRILMRTENGIVGVANPRKIMTDIFTNMMSEVRAYGQGIMIVDQVPERLCEDAIKNTNAKIVHRLVSADDRQAMAKGLNLWGDQERIIGDLQVGQALVRTDADAVPYLIQVRKI